MKTIFAALTITFFIGTGFATISAQMGGMGPGNIGPGMPGGGGTGMIGGQPVPTTFSSNGERIFFSGFNDAGQRINFSGGPFWLWMRGGSCADCHGVNGRGGFPVMMGTQIPPNITYHALTEGEHEHGGVEAGEAHEPYTDELIKRAITQGLDASGKPLDLTMPRWQMSETDLNDLIDYLKTLSTAEEIGEEVNVERAGAIASDYLSSLNIPDLALAEIVEYGQSFIAKFQEKSTGRYAFDVLIDKGDGGIYPVMGPTMGWNTKYGNGDGMMVGMPGGMMGNSLDLRISLDEAQRIARQSLVQNNLNATLRDDHLHLSYGYYEFHTEQNGKPADFIAVNGFTGQMVYETWLGPIVSINEFSGTTSGDRPQMILKPVEQIVRQGDVFSVEIAVERVNQLSGYQLKLNFHPSIVQVKEAIEGAFLRRDNAEVFFKEPVIDNLNGQIEVVAVRITKGGITGTGTLATITFEAIGVGESPLTATDVILSDSQGSRLDISVSGASLIVQNADAPWDANGDGRVDILDLVLAAQHFGETILPDAEPNPDVNRDGQVNVIDLVLVGQHFGETTAAAPSSFVSVHQADGSRLSDEQLQSLRRALAALETMPNPSHGAVIARDFLRAWLVQAKPTVTETKLMQNFPNPFNPETWMPYQLQQASHVMIRIYSAAGQLVRTIALGYKPAGMYTAKQNAAYWDGRDETGGRVSSGLYFYRLDTTGFTQTRKMIVQK